MAPTVIQRPAATGNYREGRRQPISQITFHHIVGDAPGAISRFQTPGVEVSSTYVISSKGEIFQCVDEDDTPYTDANSESNARSITIEHAGGIATVPYTDAMYDASARLVRYLIDKYDIARFERHRDVSDDPTACPGQLDVERIIREAKQGDDDMVTQELATLLWVGLFDMPDTADGYKGFQEHWVGKPTADCIKWLLAQPAHEAMVVKARDYNRVVDTAEERLRSVNILVAEALNAKKLSVAQEKIEKIKEIVNS